ncbi:hypothetical protein ACEWY4_008395 [Coilia grayii]|uniref:G-protein coupled receptors family 1 profile domain-containing protein n=1 Tax=Coilia grayii TaxID=363190 RepID=A0ABD1KAS8_9TELE
MENVTEGSVGLVERGGGGLCAGGGRAEGAEALALALVYGGALVLGLPLNAASLWVLLRRHGLKSPSAVLMIHLATSDLLLVLSLPLRVLYLARGAWTLGPAICTATTMLFRNNIRTSSIFITLISLDRLLAVVFPLRARPLRTVPCASRACACVWLLVCVVSVPEGLKLHASLPPRTCFEGVGGLGVPALAQSGLLGALLVVNVACTGLVVRALRRRALVEEGGHTHTPAYTHTPAHTHTRVTLVLGLNLLTFCVFFVPFAVVRLGLCSVWPPPTFRAAVCLASLNCCFDPLVYYCSLDGFWRPHTHACTATHTPPHLASVRSHNT